jgi:hypothetical protein
MNTSVVPAHLLLSESVQNSVGLQIVTIMGFVVYFLLSGFALFNLLRFRDQFTTALYLFYVLAFITTSTRCSFYLCENMQSSDRSRAVLMVLPGAFLLGVATAQLNIYLQLVFRLQAIEENFEKSF